MVFVLGPLSMLRIRAWPMRMCFLWFLFREGGTESRTRLDKSVCIVFVYITSFGTHVVFAIPQCLDAWYCICAEIQCVHCCWVRPVRLLHSKIDELCFTWTIIKITLKCWTEYRFRPVTSYSDVVFFLSSVDGVSLTGGSHADMMDRYGSNAKQMHRHTVVLCRTVYSTRYAEMLLCDWNWIAVFLSFCGHFSMQFKCVFARLRWLCVGWLIWCAVHVCAVIWV